jgi:hypothetical protein
VSRHNRNARRSIQIVPTPTLPEGFVPPSAALAPPPKTQDPTAPGFDDLAKVRDELHNLIKEAHGVLKDLRIETRRAKQVIPMIVAKRINAEIRKQVAELGEATERAMKLSVEKVGREFDKLEAAFLGTGHESKDGQASIPELVDIAVTQRESEKSTSQS